MVKIGRRHIAAVLAEQSLGRFNASQFSEQVAAYLLAEHRTADLEPLLRDIMQYRAERGIVEVIARSAHALTDAVRRDVERQVKAIYPAAQQIIISEEISPDVIGGVRLDFPSQQLDLSVRARLNRFKQLTASRTGQQERN